MSRNIYDLIRNDHLLGTPIEVDEFPWLQNILLNKTGGESQLTNYAKGIREIPLLPLLELE